ncbi:MAG TPA: hypothetical protein VF452_13375 [Candidatus Binatia bacterium]
MNNVAEARLRVRQWSELHPTAVLYDDEPAVLLDIASGKSLRLSWNDLIGFDEKIHSETGEPYLVLMFEPDRQIALVDPGGVAFAPSTTNSGPVQNLPAVVCLKDFLTLKERVDHYLYKHPNEAPPRESLDLVMICIAILDGARAVGFEIGDLEGDLEKSLNQLEKRTG